MNTNQMSLKRKFFMGVIIMEVGNANYSYLANNINECKDATDRSIFEEVCNSLEFITMGKFIGTPHFST